MNKNITKHILYSFVYGFLLGITLNIFQDLNNDVFNFFVTVFDFGGNFFLSVLKMLVVPIVFASIICGLFGLKDFSSLGRISLKTITVYLITTSLAISLALLVSYFIQPGFGTEIKLQTGDFSIGEKPSVLEVLLNIIPQNPFKALVEGNMLQVIVFSILLGVGISLCGENGKPLEKFFQSFNTVNLKCLEIIMRIAPFGIFCLISKTFSSQGIEIIYELGKYFFTVVFCLIFHMFLVYGSLIKFLSKIKLIFFFKQIKDAMFFAFSTSSSSATIPITLRVAKESLKIKENIASFTVPLGSTINMDGTAIMQGVATVFIANIYGMSLMPSDYLSVIVTATLASIGTAGVPGVGLIMLGMVLNQVGLPLEGIALIIGVDRILDMMRTATNVSGDIAVSLFINHTEK